MRKAKSLIGLNIISQQEGKHLGTVRDIIFDENSHKLVALLLTDRELFGMIDATVIPWSEVREIGPNAIMVPSEAAIQKAHADPIVAESFDQKKKLDGKKITTQGGEDLGRISDLYLGEGGQVDGFEVSGGLFADAFSGKRYMPMPSSLTVGSDVVLVPQEIATELQRQKEQEPGGIKGAYQSTADTVSSQTSDLTAKAGNALDSAKSKVGETYDNLATASVERQREYVIGKIASRDVIISGNEATMAAPQGVDTLALEDGAIAASSGDVVAPMQQATFASASDISSSGEVVEGEVLVRKGETITTAHADRAIAAGVLGQLVVAATGGAVSSTVDSTNASDKLAQGQDKVASYGADVQNKLETAALGKPSAREILAPDGSVIVAPGMIVTQAILDRADKYDKKNEVIAAAGMGAASEKAQDTYATAKDTAGSLWDSIKEKTAELTGNAQDKKAEYDAKAEQNKINNALGRPVTRVILAQNDSIILNTGDLITNSAVAKARDEGVLPILLDSVYSADPSITPEMLRAQGKGDAALAEQAEAVPPPTPVSVTDGQQYQPETAQNNPPQTTP